VAYDRSEEPTVEVVTFRLVAAPVQYGWEPASPRRVAAFKEHGDAIVAVLALGGPPSWTARCGDVA